MIFAIKLSRKRTLAVRYRCFYKNSIGDIFEIDKDIFGK